MADAIRLQGVRKTFGTKVAVRSLDLAIPEGSLYGFLGPNGAGKSTTIRMIMSILFPDEGQIEVLGRRSAVESKDRIGYLPEERGVYRKMRVGAFLKYMAALKGVPRAGLDAKIDGWLERMALPGVRAKRCEELSKGMQQKVQIIGTLLHEPDLIILDEPFSGLDPVNSRLLRDLIRDLHAEGRTIIFSTHVLLQAEQICDRIFMINRGRKILDGSVDEIREQFNPRTIAVEPASAIGRTAIGALPGVAAVEIAANTAGVRLADGADAQAIIRRIAAEFPVRRIELLQASLEDIFVGLVNERK